MAATNSRHQAFSRGPLKQYGSEVKLKSGEMGVKSIWNYKFKSQKATLDRTSIGFPERTRRGASALRKALLVQPEEPVGGLISNSIVYTPKNRTILRLSDRGPTTSPVAVSTEVESLEAAPPLEGSPHPEHA